MSYTDIIAQADQTIGQNGHWDGISAESVARMRLQNRFKTGLDIEVPKMRMQLRLNQFRTAKRVGPNAKIFETQIRDAMIVRRAVTLGLPVVLVMQEGADTAQDSVINDYRRLASEIIRQGAQL